MILDEQIIKDFEGKLQMFESSIKNISDGFMQKLLDLSKQTGEIAENTQFLKKMKIIYEEQNSKLEIMDATITELIARLDSIEIPSKGKKKKKKK